MERNMTNEKIVLNCIAALNNCDINSAVWFAEHNKTCYDIAMAVAQAKSVQLETERQALIDKACEWLEDNAINYVGKDGITAWRSVFADFRKVMKGGEK